MTSDNTISKRMDTLVNVRKNSIGSIVTTIIIAIISLTYIFPFIWLAYTSLKTQAEYFMSIFALPTTFNLENFEMIFTRRDVLAIFRNSFFNSTFSLIWIFALSYTLGYVLARFEFKGRKFVYMFFLASMVIPVHALLIPIFIQFRDINMIDNRFSLIMPYVAFNIPIAIYLFDSYIRGIPREMEEAAIMDGGSYFSIMTRVIFPICRPITATVLILSFLNLWNEFPFALILVTSDRYMTVPIWLTVFRGQFTVDYPLQFAAMFVASIPVVIVYLFFKNKIMQGMAAGAVKG